MENQIRLEVGPQTFIRKEHETIVDGPTKMINLPPRTFCKILNPILREEKGKPVYNTFGEVEVQFGEFEYRTAENYPDPFPLYPGEKLDGKVENLLIVQQNTCLRMIATRDFTEQEIKRVAGEEWQKAGPFTYIPRVEVEISKLVKSIVIKPNTALRLKASRAFTDRKNIPRLAGEEWLIRETGSFLPDTFEEVVEVILGQVLNDKNCLHLRANKEFVDVYKKKRKAGQEWLVRNDMAQVHIKDVYEEIIGVEKAITLSSRQQCVIVNPFNATKFENEWGIEVLIKGEKTFFLNPREELKHPGVYQIEILGEDEALLLQATQDHPDGKIDRKAGEKWIVKGPREYIAGVEVKVLERRKAIPLDANEGIYVRNNRTGEVREIKAQTYLLEAHESLWEKHLPEQAETLVARASTGAPYVPPKMNEKGQLSYDIQKPDANYKRDKTRIISFKAPHNSAVQLYDYKLKNSRVVFGPDFLMLGPDEQFTILNLSGGKPKQENMIQTLQLSLGPDFMTDQIIVETSDHAKLQLTLSYNWYFKIDKENQLEAQKLFSVKDFVGDACKTIASRVRGAVSSITFEDFHHNSSIKIREAVFGRDADNNIRGELFFPSNNLMITSVDIQGQEITDEQTRKQLARSINQAIEISSKGQEMNSRHQVTKTVYNLKRLPKLNKRLKVNCSGRSWKMTQSLRKFKSSCLSNKLKVQRSEPKVKQLPKPSLKACKRRSEERLIFKGAIQKAEVNRVQLTVQAMKVQNEQQLEQLQKEQDAEIKHKKALNDLETKRERELALIEINKFKQIVKAIGKETIIAVSKAGPETKAKLLSGLGLKGYLVTDGKNPINLFNTANGFLGGQ